MQTTILAHLYEHMKQEGLDSGVVVKQAADNHQNPPAAEALRNVCDKVFSAADIRGVARWLTQGGGETKEKQRQEALDWAWRTSWQRGDARSAVPSGTESGNTSGMSSSPNDSTWSEMSSKPAYTTTGPGFTLSSVLPVF